MEIKGIIRQVAREGKAVMLDNEQWYSHFNATTQFQVGESVKITYTDKVKDGTTYHNWKLIEPLDQPAEVVKPYGKENYQVEKENNTSGRIFNGENRGYKEVERSMGILDEKPKKEEYHLTPEMCRAKALECAIKVGAGAPPEKFWETANKFLEFIENRNGNTD